MRGGFDLPSPLFLKFVPVERAVLCRELCNEWQFKDTKSNFPPEVSQGKRGREGENGLVIFFVFENVVWALKF